MKSEPEARRNRSNRLHLELAPGKRGTDHNKVSKSKRKLKRVSTPGTTGGAQSEDQSQKDTAVEPPSQPGATEPPLSPGPATSKPTVENPNTYDEPSLLAQLAGAKRPVYKPGFVDPDLPHEFKRPAFYHFVRYPMSLILLLLNVAVTMSFVERLPRHQIMDPLKELFFFGVVGFVDVFLFIPILFEVNRVKTDADGLTLSTLYWRMRLSWAQLISFEQPKFLKFSILKTKKTFFLLNKYDLKPYFELAEIISAKMPRSIEDSET